MYSLYPHQETTRSFAADKANVFDMSDPGTGKTGAHITIARDRRTKTLVLCPLSIVQVAWGADIKKFAPDATYSIALAKNREAAFKEDVDFYITNHDAVKWLIDNFPPTHWKNWNLIVDESDAYKHRTSQRSKAIAKIAPHFAYRTLLSGTPSSTTVLDLWHQMYILDGGSLLSPEFFRFRQAVCEPIQNGPKAEHVKWVDKPGIQEVVAEIIRDVTIRHELEKCIGMPPIVYQNLPVHLPPAHQRIYDKMQAEALIELESGEVTAVHKGVLEQKLLQIASGSVYDQEKNTHKVASDRYELITDLVAARTGSLVGFVWKHQRDMLIDMAKKRGIEFGVIDGSASSQDRENVVNDFQAGNLQAVYAHPASAAHGITLTRGTSTIWASPYRNPAHYLQFNRRVYRNGQTKRTEIIHIVAENTLEGRVYDQLSGKVSAQLSLLEILKG